MTAIKIILNKEIRRSTVRISKEEPLSYDRLNSLILKLFPLLDGKSYQICYHDDERDLVTFSSNEELNEAIQYMLPKNATLKFTVKCPDLVGISSSTTTTATAEGETGEIESSSESGNIKQEGNASSASVPASATKKKPSVILPSVSVTPQEALAASALLKSGGGIDDSDSSDDDLVSPNKAAKAAGLSSSLATPITGKKRRASKKNAASDGTLPAGLTVLDGGDGSFINNDGTEGGGVSAGGGDGGDGNLTPASKRRKCYTVSEKYEIVKEYLSNRNNMTQFALEKGIKPKTFSAWMKEYQDGKLESISVNDSKKFRIRKAEYPEIETKLIEFIATYDPNAVITWSVIRQAALAYAKEILKDENEIATFKASDGWIQNFLKRNNITLKKNYVVQIGGNHHNHTSSGSSSSSSSLAQHHQQPSSLLESETTIHKG
jgi:transposase-like protein